MIIHKTFGLDLGTTNSTPSVFINGASFCPEDGKLKTIPSLVAKKGDKFIVGVAPKNNPHIEKIRSIKRMMGKEEPAVLNGQNYSPEEISAEILTGASHDYNSFEKKEVVKTAAFTDFTKKEDGFTTVIPACSVVKFTVK